MHTCDETCKAIVKEKAKGLRFAPVWNSLSHAEQQEWMVAEHAEGFMFILHRAVRAAKVLMGRE